MNAFKYSIALLWCDPNYKPFHSINRHTQKRETEEKEKRNKRIVADGGYINNKLLHAIISE